MADYPLPPAPAAEQHPLPPAPVAAGYGEVVTEDPAAHARNAPSLFADPLAWLMAEAAAAAVQDHGADLAAAGDQVGMVTVSETGTLDTMRAIAKATARGRVSPLKFAGANPGSLAGLTCIRQGFRGPTLALSMPPADGAPTAAALAAGWLARGSARYVLIGTHRQDGTVHAARCLILRAAPGPGPRTEPDLSRLTAPALLPQTTNG
ncbi:hypothetical protein ACFOVU_15120 [Nocardiopsis sediminis]|uniref:Beta-ketoacyl synthase N-terminal domain-containing protein n=1 Tax=Nocardiopsis sediminis TaxID=1778267 RepID=A0ABV8FRF1_9ACTN